MSLEIVMSNSLLLCSLWDKVARIWQRPDLADRVVMELLAPWWVKIKGRHQGTSE